MLKFVAFSLLTLMLVKFEFVFRFDFCVNLYQKVCNIRLYLFSLKIFDSSITHENGESAAGRLMLQIGKKRKEINFLQRDKKDKNTVSGMAIMSLFSNLLITELGVSTKIGDKNALRATMLMGSAKIFYYSIISFLKSKQNFKIYESFVPYYSDDVFIIDIYGILNISIADIIFSLIINSLKKIRQGQFKRRDTEQ